MVEYYIDVIFFKVLHRTENGYGICHTDRV